MSHMVPDRNICLKPGVVVQGFFYTHIYLDYFHQAQGFFYTLIYLDYFHQAQGFFCTLSGRHSR